MTLALSNPTLLSHLIISDIAPTNKPLRPEFVTYISAMQHINSLAPGVIRTREDADRVLAQYEPVHRLLNKPCMLCWERVQNLSIRQFLLTNLILPPHSAHTPSASTRGAHNKPRFALPLDLIEHSIPALGAFPWEHRVPVGREGQKPEHPTWDGPTLVVRGTKSSYITDENLPSFKAFFPNSRVEELDAGHWGTSFFLSCFSFFNGRCWRRKCLIVHAEKPKEFLELVVEFLDGK